MGQSQRQPEKDGSHPLKIEPQGISLKAAGYSGTDGQGVTLSTKLKRGNQNIISLVREGEQVGIGHICLQCRQKSCRQGLQLLTLEICQLSFLIS